MADKLLLVLASILFLFGYGAVKEIRGERRFPWITFRIFSVCFLLGWFIAILIGAI